MAPLSKPGYAEKALGVISLREEIAGVPDRLFSGILFLMILRYPGLMIRLQSGSLFPLAAVAYYV